jgi:hypothetical protein
MRTGAAAQVTVGYVRSAALRDADAIKYHLRLMDGLLLLRFDSTIPVHC